MKVLFLSHYKNNDTVGFFAQNLMLAIHKAGIDIVFRHIDNGKDQSAKLHPILLPFEAEPIVDCTHCIQFLQPEYVTGTKKFLKNIAIVSERGSNYNNLLVMDEIWVFNEKIKNELQKFVSEDKIRIVFPVLNDIKDKLSFIYDSGAMLGFENFTLSSVGKNIKEILSA